MRLTQLDVVNACLATMGESPLVAVDQDHPYVQAALTALRNSSTLVQGEGWWFNTDGQTIAIDPGNGYAYAPADALSVETQAPAVINRGTRLYDQRTSTYDMRPLFGGGPIKAVIIREIPFEDIPTLAQHAISERAQLDFQASFDGDDNKYSKIGGAYTLAHRLLKAEHIRQSRVNLFESTSMQEKLRLMRPMSRGMRIGHRNW
ncbi:phage tail protein [Paraburkholderia youngii]|uniref:Phage tail protein n=1 Tax=Paraburkholderia youngii TaxID=2782701 RepID=A0A7Y6JUM7_9BURK|nr:phage tail protein [Paraburkholderia youngii]NUX98781.1 phage tail protein [Paraburkholderia youngii]